MSADADVDLVIDAAAALGEGPCWDAVASELLWVDFLGETIHRSDPVKRQDRTIPIGQPVTVALPRRDGGLALAVRDGFAVLTEQGSVQMIAAVEADSPRRMNDGKCDAAGRFWAGTNSGPTGRNGVLYRLDADGTVHRVIEGLTLSNGLDWSPDGTLMYLVDSLAYCIDEFAFDVETGRLDDRRTLLQMDRNWGIPDGMAIDSDGYLWVAFFGGWSIRRFRPDGTLDGEIALPVAQVTSCAFGGPSLDDLYITTAAHGLSAADADAQPDAGGIFRYRAGVQGRLPNSFAA